MSDAASVSSEKARSSLRRPDGSPVRVLVVDDERSLAELISMALRYEGWEIHVAGDGMSAVKLARQVHPDIVVLDVMLPDVSGLEVLRQLRDLYPGIAAVAAHGEGLTGRSDSGPDRWRRRLRD